MSTGTPQRNERGEAQSLPRRVWSRAAWPALALVALAVVALTLVTQLGSGTRHSLVVASIPYWNMQHDTAAVLANRHDVTEVSPWFYGLSAGGTIVPQYASGQAGSASADIAKLRAAGLLIVPSIANVVNGNFSYQPLARILHDPVLAREQVNAIVAMVDKNHYAGIDIDYEGLHAGDQAVYLGFIRELGSALHARGKVLSVDVFPQTSAADVSQSNPAQNYAAIGKVADQVRIMGYNYHWAGSPPGAVAPIGWVRSVLKYAVSQMPASKVVLGVPLYGFDWGDGPAHTISWLQALRLSRQYDAAPSYDKVNQAPTFTYTSHGRLHHVWFENAESTTAKLDAAKGDSVAGVNLWMPGYEDPGTWPALHSTLPTSGPGASSSSTAVP
jgi:spore germination protein YaaH